MEKIAVTGIISAEQRGRNRDCESAMKTVFERALASALDLGWTDIESAFFIAEVADDYISKKLTPRNGATDGKVSEQLSVELSTKRVDLEIV